MTVALIEPIPSGMSPLQVTATLRSPMASAGVRLDALLAWVVTQVENIPPALTPEDIVPIDIPVERSACGRFHLCSDSFGEVEARERRWINRRFPIAEAQDLAVDTFRRIAINAGAQKSFRIPQETRTLVDDRLTWWLVGDARRVAELLEHVSYLGARRAVGRGAVLGWRVEACETWPGFPVLRDGEPLRVLPADHPDVGAEAERAYATLTYPYWNRAAEELCVMPRRA